MHVQTLHLLIDAVTLLNNRELLERVEKMSQYTELKAQIAKLQEQAEEARRAELEAVLADIRRKIVEYGLTAQDLGLSVVRRGRPPKKEPLPPIYQDPKSGSTWSGRGKPPKWIAGKNRERFLISQAHS
ncbi:DNA-binding protein H-NS [Burkholderia sp. D7]|nr:DNA-binding protein H-NS [Burkholderia sp. D7]